MSIWGEILMKNDLLKYLSGLCQATSAALLAAAMIMPDVREQALWGTAMIATVGAMFVILKTNGEYPC